MTMADPYGGFSAGDARFAPPAGAPPLSVPGKTGGQEVPADSYMPHGAPVKENGTQEIYHYCLVRFSGSGTALAYRTEDRTLQPGDRVRAPYGRDNAPRTGKVAAVGDYTAADAPYPPEKTKLLFGRASAQECADADEEERQRRARRERRAAERAKAAAADEPPAAAVPDEPERTDENGRTDGKEQAAERVPGKRHVGRWVGAAVAAAACVAAVAAAVPRVRAWNACVADARQTLLGGDYRAAYEKLDGVPPFFGADVGALSRAAACAAGSGTRDEVDDAIADVRRIGAGGDEELADYAAWLEPTLLARADRLALSAALDAAADNDMETFLQLLPEGSADSEQIEQIFRAVYFGGDDSDELRRMLSRLDEMMKSYTGADRKNLAVLRDRLAEAADDAEDEEKWLAERKASGLPYVGMPEDRVEQTRQLGKAHHSFALTRPFKLWADRIERRSGTLYTWRADDGTDVFKAFCYQGKVLTVEKLGGSDYWNGDTFINRQRPKPSRFTGGGSGSGNSSSGNGSHSLRDDYDDPEDLYEDGGYDDLDEAWDEWEDD